MFVGANSANLNPRNPLRAIAAKPELEVEIAYKDLIVGQHRLDLFVADEVVVELKAISGIAEIHVAQALSYMKATHVEVGLIINFGEDSLSWKRLVRKSRMSTGV